MGEGDDEGDWQAPDVNADRPSRARVYDLFLGGKDNYEVDRQVYQQVLKVAPEAPEVARANRRWLGEAVERMARESGIDQFLDLGSGLPTNDNTHEVVQRINRNATVVYLDNDPTAISHGLALLADERHVHFVAGDLANPPKVLANPIVAGALDLTRPVGIILGMSLHHIVDTAQARDIVNGYLDAFPSGSYLAITHLSNPRDGSRLRRVRERGRGQVPGRVGDHHVPHPRRDRDPVRRCRTGRAWPDQGQRVVARPSHRTQRSKPPAGGRAGPQALKPVARSSSRPR